MKKSRREKQFMEQLEKHASVSAACENIGISRNTIYRWRKEDKDFANRMDEAMFMGIDSINDLAEGKLKTALKNGEPWAIKYWLDNNKKNYARPRPRDFWSVFENPDDKVSKITVEIVDQKKTERKEEAKNTPPPVNSNEIAPIENVTIDIPDRPTKT